MPEFQLRPGSYAWHDQQQTNSYPNTYDLTPNPILPVTNGATNALGGYANQQIIGARDINTKLRLSFLWGAYLDTTGLRSIDWLDQDKNFALTDSRLTYSIGGDIFFQLTTDVVTRATYLLHGVRYETDFNLLGNLLTNEKPVEPLGILGNFFPAGRIWVYLRWTDGRVRQERLDGAPVDTPQAEEITLVGVDYDGAGEVTVGDIAPITLPLPDKGIEIVAPLILDDFKVPSGGTLTIQSGAKLTVESGGALCAKAQTAVQFSQGLVAGTGTTAKLMTNPEPYAFVGADFVDFRINGGPTISVPLDTLPAIVDSEGLAKAFAVIQPANIADSGSEVTIISYTVGGLSNIRVDAISANANAELGLAVGDNFGTSNVALEVDPIAEQIIATSLSVNVEGNGLDPALTLENAGAPALIVNDPSEFNAAVDTGAAVTITLGAGAIVTSADGVITITTLGNTPAIAGVGGPNSASSGSSGTATDDDAAGAFGQSSATGSVLGAGVSGLGFNEAPGVKGSNTSDGYGVQALGRVGAPIRASLNVSDQDDDPSTLAVGDIFFRNYAGPLTFMRAVIQNVVAKFVAFANSPPLHEKELVLTQTVLSGNTASVTANILLDLPTTDEIELSVELCLTIPNAGDATITFFDNTAGGPVGKTRIVDSVDSGETNCITIVEFVTPPATGTRNYSCDLTANQDVDIEDAGWFVIKARGAS